MVREFTADRLVVLPKLSADSGLALWQALQAGVANEKKLPKFLLSSWQGVANAGAELFQAAQARLTGNGTKSPPLKRKVDAVVDNVVAALDDWLAAWMRLADTAEGQLAATVRQRLFPDGTGFLKKPYTEQWAQVEQRLALINSEGLDKQIAQLGGSLFITKIQEAQQAYGKVLGLTAVPAAPGAPVTLRDPLAALESALRLYIIKVTAYRDEEEPATVALSERLLQPITTWASKAANGSGNNDPEPTPTPAGA